MVCSYAFSGLSARDALDIKPYNRMVGLANTTVTHNHLIMIPVCEGGGAQSYMRLLRLSFRNQGEHTK